MSLHFPDLACTAFSEGRCLAAGPLETLLQLSPRPADLRLFDDSTGRWLEIDWRGDASQIAARVLRTTPAEAGEADAPAATRGRGRPRLGVVAREVTLLPRHWDWLGQQPGGASVVLRRLVEDARRTAPQGGNPREAREIAYRALVVLAGDAPGFEEASRALFAGDRESFLSHSAGWPADVVAYGVRLAGPGWTTVAA